MTRTLLVVFLLFLFLPACARAEEAEDDDFWLLLDYEEPPQSAIWLYGGQDQENGGYYGVSADLAVVDELHFNFTVTEQDYAVATTDLRWGFSGIINRYFSWSLLKTFWGRRDQLEKNDTRFALSFFYRRLNLRVAYETGDIELFLRRSRFIRRNSVDTTHQAYELSAGYSWQAFYTQLGFRQHHYDRDLSLLYRRPRLFLAFDTVSIQQATALADYEASILLGINADSMVYELFIARIKSAVTRILDTYATVHLARSMTRKFELGFDFELPVNEVPFSAGISLGFKW